MSRIHFAIEVRCIMTLIIFGVSIKHNHIFCDVPYYKDSFVRCDYAQMFFV